MKVTPMEGSPTVFMVESRSLQCTRCARRFNQRDQKKFGGLKPGDACPRCCGTLKRVLPYQCDLSEDFPIGRCACIDGMNRNSRARRLTQAERLALDDEAQDQYRCRHLRAARSFALNRELAHFERERLKGIKGKKESDTR
jgi:hypothetical protein